MTEEIRARAEARKNRITLTKVDLHSASHHSLNPSLTALQAWEMVCKLAHESYALEHGTPAPTRADRSVVRLIKTSSS